jgi:hypothetical protein
MNQEYVNMMETMAASMGAASSFSSLLSLAGYVFSALAIYTIAQRREINHAWMAWIPLINVWVLGSISDQYRYVDRGEVKNKRKVLLALNITNCVLAVIGTIMVVVSIVSTILAIDSGAYINEVELLGKVLLSFLIFVPVAILGIVSFIIQAIALYDLYTSCDPANNVLYLVLSLIPALSAITRPLFLFLCRNKDEGMPPRQEAL